MQPVKHGQQRLAALSGSLFIAVAMAIVVLGVTSIRPVRSVAAATPAGAAQPGYRTRDEAAAPTISFIESPGATCHSLQVGADTCFVRWNYLYVTAASGGYIISMTVSIDDQIRAYHSGFFQTYMFIPNDMTGIGYRVACGAPGSDGVPGWGHSYPYIIRARDTYGYGAANYGSVRCPAQTGVPTVIAIHSTELAATSALPAVLSALLLCGLTMRAVAWRRAYSRANAIAAP